jgi:hypothetical protein
MLHQQPATGAIFALKSLGWLDKQIHDKPVSDISIKIEIVETGPAPAAREQEVSLQ